MEKKKFMSESEFLPIFAIAKQQSEKFKISTELKYEFIQRAEDDAYQCSLAVCTDLAVFEFIIDEEGMTLEFSEINLDYGKFSLDSLQNLFALSVAISKDINDFVINISDLFKFLELAEYGLETDLQLDGSGEFGKVIYRNYYDSVSKKVKEIAKTYSYGLELLISGLEDNDKQFILEMYQRENN